MSMSEKSLVKVSERHCRQKLESMGLCKHDVGVYPHLDVSLAYTHLFGGLAHTHYPTTSS